MTTASPPNTASKFGLSVAILLASLVLVLVVSATVSELRKTPEDVLRDRAQDCVHSTMERMITAGSSRANAELAAASTCREALRAAKNR